MIARRFVTMVVLCSLAASQAASKQPSSLVQIGMLTDSEPRPRPASPLDQYIADQAVEGARLAVEDNATTGRFTGHDFRLLQRRIASGEEALAAVRELVAAGAAFIVSDLALAHLKAVLADVPAGTTLINVALPDDSLRNEDCHPALLHAAPSRAMAADALAQYLVVRRWTRWLLVVGRHDEDRLRADSYRAAAKRFGARIVEEKTWSFSPGNPHADSGHVTLQAEIPPFTRAADHDVLIVADEHDEFGEYLPYRTWSPRPVAGTHGLVATAWSPVQEQWGGLQLQARFQRQTGRLMGVRDYIAWLAVRAVGEAVVRTASDDPQVMRRFMLGPEFRLGGFKGQPLTFRPWNGQLRQPMLIAGPRLLVSVSPQPEFLHQGSPLDSLGVDAAETRCARW